MKNDPLAICLRAATTWDKTPAWGKHIQPHAGGGQTTAIHEKLTQAAVGKPYTPWGWRGM